MFVYFDIAKRSLRLSFAGDIKLNLALEWNPFVFLVPVKNEVFFPEWFVISPETTVSLDFTVECTSFNSSFK